MNINKSPLEAKVTGTELKSLRRKLGINQLAFWAPLGLTQSAGSRYESGQNIPNSTLILIHLIYLSKDPAIDLIKHQKVWALVDK